MRINTVRFIKFMFELPQNKRYLTQSQIIYLGSDPFADAGGKDYFVMLRDGGRN